MPQAGARAAELAATARSIPRIVVLWIVGIAGVVAVAALGYMFLEGWNLEDAVYMTVMTLTTVGFREVHELSSVGRVWTMVFSFTGVAIIFGTVGIVAESFVADALSGRRAEKRMTDRIADLRGHFILCGFGRVGTTVAKELEHARIPFVIVDINQHSLESATTAGLLVVEGDATRDEVLVHAGVEHARGLITTTDSDANNVYVTLSARALNKDLFIVARANDESAEDKLRQAGADRVVSPYSRAGRQIAELAARPRVADFIDFALSHGEVSFSIEEIQVPDELAGHTVADLVARGIHPLAIAHGPREFDANPPLDRKLERGDELIISGTAEALRGLR
jgi:voltage-gated potassium channel